MSRAERIAQRFTLGQISDFRRESVSRGLPRVGALFRSAFNARFAVVIERNRAERQASLFSGGGDEP